MIMGEDRRRRKTVKEWLRDNPAKMSSFLSTVQGKKPDKLEPDHRITQTVFDALPHEWDTMLPNGLYLARTHGKGLGLFCIYDIEANVLVSEFDTRGATLDSGTQASLYAIRFTENGDTYILDPFQDITGGDKGDFIAFMVNEPGPNE